ncbi:MAG: HAD family phosphatase [Zhengella sp.]|uniref:HAD family hydrolase n=1 Tax=Zhengella sp. TaxID=2282762 RepID=UPI001E0C95AF|nr:HAD family phosphatase [Notoacmeibacter sp.]MCC0026248.1 HAD family phosphatase [Brucellaceae bacterium]
MPKIRHIVFDIGRVLIHYDPDLPYRTIIPDPDKRAWFFENVCTGAWNVEQDRGRGWREAEAELIAIYPDWEKEIRAFRENWHAMVPHALDDTVAVLRQLVADGHDVTMLTNFAADTFAEASRRFDFLSETRGVTVSGLIGVIKPDRAIYDQHANTFGLDPAASLFIDDSPKNVEGARAAGWQALHFTGAGPLRADLQHLGVAI